MADFNKVIALIFAIVVLIIAGVGLANDLVNNATTPTTVTSESFTGLNGVAVSLDNSPIVAGSDRIFNSTGFNLTRGTNYTISLTAGTVTVLSTNFNQSLLADYKYEQVGFIGGTGATLLLLIPLLLALFLIVLVFRTF